MAAVRTEIPSADSLTCEKYQCRNSQTCRSDGQALMLYDKLRAAAAIQADPARVPLNSGVRLLRVCKL